MVSEIHKNSTNRLTNPMIFMILFDSGGPFKKYIDKVGDVNFSYSDGEYPLSLAIRKLCNSSIYFEYFDAKIFICVQVLVGRILWNFYGAKMPILTL